VNEIPPFERGCLVQAPLGRGFHHVLWFYYHQLKDSEAMTGIQFVTDEQGRKVGVLIDLKKHGAIWADFWDGLVSESRRKEKGIPYEQYRATRLKRARPRG
jgi:hypothetical protein